ncbi:hypothetical protein QTP88_029612 [Uroleucon formosanum]
MMAEADMSFFVDFWIIISSFFKSLKSVHTTKTNANPERHSTRKKVKPVYYKNDHHKVYEWLNSTQNEFHQNNSLLINSSSDENNDDDILDKTYNINTELICSDSESEPVCHNINDFEVHDDTVSPEEVPVISNLDVHDENTTTLCEEQSPVSNLDNNGINTEVIDEINVHEPPKKKTRIEEKYLKDHGMEYNNRKGVTIPQNKFKELINCCRRKCDIVCPPDKQKIIFELFYKLEKEIQYQIMSCGITLTDKKSTRLGRGRLWQHCDVLRGQKSRHTEGTMTWSIVMMKDPRFGNLWTDSNDSFSQPIEYFQRNLSNNSPSQIDKNTKVFVTPNRYAVLNTDEDKVLTTPSASTTKDPDRPPQKVHNAKPVAPPIHIKNISNFSAFNTILKNITGPNGYTCKSTPSYLIVQPTDKRSYNAIIDHLHETNASFHSFSPPSLRTYRVVIKNLHSSTLHTDITSALTELGHSVKSIYNAKNRNNCPLPVFFVDIRQQDNNNDIHDITSLLNTIVKIEKPIKKRRGPSQCHNCQDYGHTKNYCSHKARCVKCGENHQTIECTKDRNSPAKCALCAKDHTANFKGCPAFQSIFKKSAQKFQPVKDPDYHSQQSQPKTKTKSYAEANNQNKITEQISNTFSKLISNLSSLINPLISLLTSVLNTLIAKDFISP